MAKRNGVPKITKAWLEWARQRYACVPVMNQLRPGMPVTVLDFQALDWVLSELRLDGIELNVFPRCKAGCRICDADPALFLPWPDLAIRIAREVEIVDV